MTSLDVAAGDNLHTSRIIHRQWLTKDTFTLALERPPDFQFQAGQRIRLLIGGKHRDYSLIPGDTPAELILLIRWMDSGVVSTHLSRCPLATSLNFSGPSGHFIYRPSSRPAIFIATGTGIAPFAAMCREGVQGFVLLHGVRDVGALYYRDLMEPAAARYSPCLTGAMPSLPSEAFPGRVTMYLRQQWPAGEYDFYLAGRREMIAEVIDIVDDRFSSSRVYSEIFY
jgi:benzoate/toluate 1,2-dioxygenase reductase subunit